MSRRKVVEAEKEIASKKGMVKGFEEELIRYEQESIVPVESQIREYKADKAAYETAKKFFPKFADYRTASGLIDDSRVKKYLKKMYQQRDLNLKSQKQFEDIAEKVSVAGVESLTDFEKKRFDVGIKSGILSWKEEVKDIKTDLPKFDTVKSDVFKSPETKLTDRRKFGARVTGFFTSGLIPTVSAKNLSTPDNILSYDTNGDSRTSMGVSGSMGSRITGFVSNIIGDKKDFKKGTEVFSQKTGTFQTVRADPQLSKGTIEVTSQRLPTPLEKRKIELRESKLLTKDISKLGPRPINTVSTAASKSLAEGIVGFTEKVDVGTSMIKQKGGVAIPEIRVSREARVKGIQTAADIGKYAIPTAGQALFFAEGAELGVVAEKQKRETGTIQPEIKKEALFFAGFAATGGVIRAAKVIKSKSITGAVQKEITAVEGKTIKSLTIIDEGAGRVRAKGITQVGKTTREIEYTGRIAKTERGVKFVPEGVGTITIRGQAQPQVLGLLSKPRTFVSSTGFELGGKGKNLFIKKIGDARVYEELGTSTIIPRRELFGITKKTGNKAVTDLERQLASSRPSKAVVTKEVTAPIGQRNLFFELNKKIGLRKSPQEVGIVITKPKVKEIKDIGLKGAGKKSSQQFFKDLYQPSQVITPSLEKITSKIKIKAPEISTGIKTVSAKPESPRLATPLVKTETKPTETKTITLQREKTLLDVSPQLKVSSSLKTETRVTQKETLDIIPKERVVPKTETKPIQTTKVSQATKTRIAQPLIKTSKEKTKPKTTKKETTPRVIIKPKKAAVVSIPRKREAGFEILQIIKGKKKKTGEAEDILAAAAKLKKGLKGGLQASGFIVEKGTKKQVKASKVLDVLGTEFRAGKRDPFKIVEKKEKRLRKAGTGKEIQAFRTKPSKRKVNLLGGL
jgi:hypothetical protein